MQVGWRSEFINEYHTYRSNYLYLSQMTVSTVSENHFRFLSCLWITLKKSVVYYHVQKQKSPSFTTHFMYISFWRTFPLDVEGIFVSSSCFHQVRVEFLESAGVCSAASKKGKYRTTVNVDKDSSVAVSFVIVPMTLESQHIEVKASISDYDDGVRKTLKVVVRLMQFQHLI